MAIDPDKILQKYLRKRTEEELKEIEENDETLKNLLTILKEYSPKYDISWYLNVRDEEGLSLLHSQNILWKEKKSLFKKIHEFVD